MSSSMAAMRRRWKLSPANCEARAFRSRPPPSTPMMSAAIRSFFGGLKRLDVLVNNIGFMQMKTFAALQAAGFRRHLCRHGRHRL